jgi:hypothetical protein
MRVPAGRQLVAWSAAFVVVLAVGAVNQVFFTGTGRLAEGRSEIQARIQVIADFKSREE